MTDVKPQDDITKRDFTGRKFETFSAEEREELKRRFLYAWPNFLNEINK